MHRVLSFQMGRGFGESNEFVTKRMCFSFIFFIGFLALIGGFLLGRLSTERTVKLREERKRLETIEKSLDSNRQLEYLILEELEKIPLDQFNVTNDLEKVANKSDDDHHENVKTTLSNLHLFNKIVEKKSSIIATLLGSSEPDRWIVLSVSRDGTELAYQLGRIFAKLRVNHNWKPKRTIIFCFFDRAHGSCCDDIPRYFQTRIMACLAVYKTAMQRNECFGISGSDLVKSSVLKTVGTVEDLISGQDSNDRRFFDMCKHTDSSQSWTLLPRLPLNVPHASFSFVTNNITSVEYTILTKIIGFNVWKFSNDIILQWDLNNFEHDVKTALSRVISPEFEKTKEKITTTLQKLISSAQSLKEKIKSVDKSDLLAVRMTNDLLMDLDRALLCSDIDLRSKTDLALIPGLLSNSSITIGEHLETIAKCYMDAAEVLQEG